MRQIQIILTGTEVFSKNAHKNFLYTVEGCAEIDYVFDQAQNQKPSHAD